MNMGRGRVNDAVRRREKVTKVILQAQQAGGDLSVSAVARRAGVDRSYLYRHRDLLELIHQTQCSPAAGSSVTISRASLQTDLANAHERNRRLQARSQLLERRLSELMGDQAWRDSGLGAPTDIETLQRRIVELEQQNAELTGQIEDRDRDLTAARAANRELMLQLNAR
ncbi:DUF6262 family protein [Catellatospora bangladeshensis]|uniref:Transposase n=1 Tax=Catellatospora bangladeshensis TaxID=310355 RepID=A0A8J3JP96_9ACTN|nr:DUF6262 family protein [Catellatospora bangladeshensis]GIF86054.1 hypothetical protein Cba03nite_74030 [Catellatospora bangladeshensis]